MTDREKAIVMARTGICMLEGEKLDLFYQYLAELFSRPVYTHELPTLQSEIEKRSNADFIKICRDEQPHWIPVTERLPEYGAEALTINTDGDYEINHVIDEEDGEWFFDGAVAWMPLPEPYKKEEKNEL